MYNPYSNSVKNDKKHIDSGMPLKKEIILYPFTEKECIIYFILNSSLQGETYIFHDLYAGHRLTESLLILMEHHS